MNPRMTKHKTLTEYQREEINNVVVNTLGEQYATLRLVHLTIKEDVIEETTEIKCDMLLGGKKLTVKGAGNGPIDALFTALVKKFSPEYCSLENLKVYTSLDKNVCTLRLKRATTCKLELVAVLCI